MMYVSGCSEMEIHVEIIRYSEYTLYYVYSYFIFILNFCFCISGNIFRFYMTYCIRTFVYELAKLLSTRGYVHFYISKKCNVNVDVNL